MSPAPPHRFGSFRTAGFTLFELLIVMSILGILSSIGVYSFLSLKNPAKDDAQAMVVGFTQARTNAMANTLAYRILYAGGNLSLQSALSCSATTGWTTQDTQFILLSTGVSLTTTAPTTGTTAGVIVCYNPRGLAAASADVTLADTRSHSYTLRSYYGGATRVVKNAS